MKSKSVILMASLCLSGASFAEPAPNQKADIPISEVPKVVLSAANKAVPGLAVNDAKRRSKKSGVIFKLEGTAAGKEYALKIDSAGRVLDVEQDEQRRRRGPDGDKAAARRDAHADSPARQVGTLSHEPIRESSGIVASRKHSGVLWTHNDASNAPMLYAVTAEGKLLAEYAVDAPADDWEDIAADEHANLYIGNIGNNEGHRPFLEVYRISEPDPAAAKVGGRPATLKVGRTWRLEFPDEPLNCESLFIHAGQGYVVSKLFKHEAASLYRFSLENEGKVTLEKVAGLPIHSPVTAADLSWDGRTMAVLAEAGLFLFEVGGRPAASGSAEPRIIPVPRGKLEGACFTPQGIVLTAEDRQIYRIEP